MRKLWLDEDTVSVRKDEHCCQFMNTFLSDPRVGVHYCARRRNYFIDLVGGPAKQDIFSCPWCGSVFLPNLWDKYFEILQKEYGIDDPYDDGQSKRIPEEFKTDEWWKKRGL